MDASGILDINDAIVGVDIGCTKMMAAVYDRSFKKLGVARKRSREKKNGESEGRVLTVIQEALQDAGNPVIKGIGVGAPGPLDPHTGVIIDTPNLGWKNYPLADVLGRAFKVPVVLDNDVNVGTYGEWCSTDLNTCRHVLGVFPGTGIGGGIIIDGRLLQGFSGAAGEIGHMTVSSRRPLLRLRKRGCLRGGRLAHRHRQGSRRPCRATMPLHPGKMRYRPVRDPQRRAGPRH